MLLKAGELSLFCTYKMDLKEPHRVKPVLVLFLCFINQALSMGFFVSFGTVYVELISIYHTTEAQAGKFPHVAKR